MVLQYFLELLVCPVQDLVLKQLTEASGMSIELREYIFLVSMYNFINFSIQVNENTSFVLFETEITGVFVLSERLNHERQMIYTHIYVVLITSRLID